MSFDIMQATHSPWFAEEIVMTATQLEEEGILSRYNMEALVWEALDNLGSDPVWTIPEAEGAVEAAITFLSRLYTVDQILDGVDLELLSDAIASGLLDVQLAEAALALEMAHV